MWLILLLFIEFVRLSSSNEHVNCYFTVLYSNGSRSWCLDEECSNHIDIISLEDRQCRTNYLSLKFSSYSKYFDVLVLSSSRIPLSSFFSSGRPDIERLLQIEFLTPFNNDNPFKLDQFRLLTGSISNIDTYELVFNGNIAKNNLTLFIDRDIFMSDEQHFIDTLRLIFNCTKSERVEWELVKSIESLPDSPCPQQIDFLKKDFIKNQNCFNINILVSFKINQKKKSLIFFVIDKCYCICKYYYCYYNCFIFMELSL